MEGGAGPYVIQGTVDGRPLHEAVMALTLDHGGVACVIDGWLRLGTPGDGGLCVVDEDAVIARAAAWIRSEP